MHNHDDYIRLISTPVVCPFCHGEYDAKEFERFKAAMEAKFSETNNEEDKRDSSMSDMRGQI